MSPLVMHCLLSGLCALVVAWVGTALMKPLSRKLGIVDKPDPRKIHREPIAYMGGVGMFLGLVAGLATFGTLNPEHSFLAHSELYAVLLGGLAVVMMGLWDDVRGASAWPKLGFEIVLGVFMWMQGIRIEQITLPLLGRIELAAAHGPGEPVALTFSILNLVSLAITIGWYAMLMNAINLIDGLDGLAGSLSCVGALVVVATSLVTTAQPQALVLLLGVLIAAICLGFLFFNWHPASIFMGDTGALLLGFLLATTSLLSSTKSPTLLTLLIPLLAAGLPIFESVHSFMRRILSGQNPFRADRRHLHHRLLGLGLTHPQIVRMLVLATMFLGVLSILLTTAPPVATMITFVALATGSLVLLENLTAVEQALHRRIEAATTPAPHPAIPAAHGASSAAPPGPAIAAVANKTG